MKNYRTKSKYHVIIKCKEEGTKIVDMYMDCNPIVFKQIYTGLCQLYPKNQGYNYEVRDTHEIPLMTVKSGV